ncbi:MAG TPA: ABC transporter ATP-binding protein [Kiritimatiellia bacterium]|nr:ABC transporter ATP-binding protein [Kiritimatiellia bacterium]
MTAPLLTFRDLHYAHPGGADVLRGASMSLAPGERVGLTGANGSGKSTLLHLAVGLYKPASGEIMYDGRERRTERDFEDMRRGVGLLFQNSDDQLFCTTVEEDLAFGPFNLGWPRDRVAARVEQVLGQLAIAPLARRVTYRLSEGEKRLVALGTLLTMEPRVLLLDEPTNGLDDAARARLLDILHELPVAMLIATHDTALLDALAATRVHLANGVLAAR